LAENALLDIQMPCFSRRLPFDTGCKLQGTSYKKIKGAKKWFGIHSKNYSPE
jgi:hypothetical protein